MKELSHGAREALEQGLAFDGPSDEQRVRVKQRMLVALGGGAIALGSAATAAGAGSAATGAVASAASAATAKGLLAGSLWVWFGIGIATGVGASGAAAVVSMSSQPSVVASSSRTSTAGDALASRVAPSAQPSFERSIQEPASPLATVPEPASEPRVRPNSELASAAPPADPTAANPVSSAPSTLHEEAALLQAAQRALAAHQPEQALATLAEHERRFPAGVLREERQAARILAYCAVGRADEARALVRTFAHSSPRSVLIPRLADSCAGDALKR